ncbi:MAG: maleylpyruvate isomerase family mycothiol-dependent enzyme [Candidatus Dormibacteria bacterium]
MLAPIEFSTFLKHLRTDGDRLALVARDHLSADVPPCPGWTVRDVVTHVAQVCEHKIACTLLQRAPDPWPPEWPPERDPLSWFGDAHQRLLDLLSERGAEAPSYTWWPPDQTVGFWARRMAQETVIHRVDAELSYSQLTRVDPELAVDGVDEVLTIFLAGDWSEAPSDQCHGQRIEVRTDGRAWEVELLADTVNVTQPRGDAHAQLEGPPEPVLLWLWGRGSTGELHQTGDIAVMSLLRERLKLATQ